MDSGLTLGKLSRGRQYTRRAPHERVLARTERAGDCLLYVGALKENGYGVTNVWDEERQCWVMGYVHRIVYEALVGPIPAGYVVDHVKDRGCRFTNCVNVEHLEPVPHRENVIRGVRPAQMAVENRDPSRRRGSRRWR